MGGVQANLPEWEGSICRVPVLPQPNELQGFQWHQPSVAASEDLPRQGGCDAAAAQGFLLPMWYTSISICALMTSIVLLRGLSLLVFCWFKVARCRLQDVIA